MLETELKCIITEDVYNKIKSAFDWDYTAEQINYYYADNSGELKKRRIMVRVRVKNGISKLQIKQRKNSSSPLQVCEENEFDIDGIPEVIPSDTASDVIGLDVGELRLIGSAQTLRSSLMWDASTEICLDRTKYFDTIDYEIEVEYKDTLNDKLADKLLQLGVEFKENSIGKFSRFMRKFDELNK